MNINIGKALITLLIYILGNMVGVYAYEAPLGIPAPDFGIYSQAPSLPSPWNADVADFYYVKSGGTNAGNGYPDDPRGNIPGSALNAGSVIVIEGEYNNSESVTFNGTALKPVFVISSDLAQAVLKKKWTLKGSYFVLDGINAEWDNSSGNGKISITQAHYGTVKNGNFRGDTGNGIGGINIGDSDYILLFQNEVHHGGNFLTEVDQDVHGTSIGDNTHYVWILDSEYHHNSGNGIQINGNSNESVSSIYVGRNNLHENVQSGFGLKKSRDIIVSQNESWGARIRPWSGGNGMGAQYGPDYVWFICNYIYDNEEGIRISSDSGGLGTEHFFIGNIIYNIHKISPYNPNNPWERSAIGIWGGENTYIVNNTIWDVDGGIFSPRGDGRIIMANNIIGKVNDSSFYLNISKPLLGNSELDRNIYLGSGSIMHGNDVFTFEEMQTSFGYEENGLSIDSIEFINEPAYNLRLQPNSLVQNKAKRHAVFDIFQNRYGMDINNDCDGTPRAASGRWEPGAYEISNTPDAPTGVTGTVLGL